MITFSAALYAITHSINQSNTHVVINNDEQSVFELFIARLRWLSIFWFFFLFLTYFISYLIFNVCSYFRSVYLIRLLKIVCFLLIGFRLLLFFFFYFISFFRNCLCDFRHRIKRTLIWMTFTFIWHLWWISICLLYKYVYVCYLSY